MDFATRKMKAAKAAVALAKRMTRGCTKAQEDAILWTIRVAPVAVGIEKGKSDFDVYARDGLETLPGGKLPIFKKARAIQRANRKKELERFRAKMLAEQKT